MKELNEIVIKKMQEMIVSGTIEDMITKNLEQTMSVAIEKSMMIYSDFGKVIENKIKESLNISQQQITLPVYNKFIQEVINKKFIDVLEETGIKHLSELVDKIMGPVEKEIKISKTLAMVEELWGSVAREHGKHEIEIEISGNPDDTAIYAHIKHPEYDWYDVNVTFYNFDQNSDKWHIGYINIDGKCITNSVVSTAGYKQNSMSDLFFKFYARETLFEMDVEIESIRICD